MARLPGTRLPMLEGAGFSARVIQAPPVTRIQVRTSQKWRNDNPKNANAVANDILNEQSSEILAFIYAQRQNAEVSGLNVTRKRRDLNGVFIMYSNIQGTEYIDILVVPESYGAKHPVYVVAPGGYVIDIDVPFVSWPFPGDQVSADTRLKLFRTPDYAALSVYDPGFSPGVDDVQGNYIADPGFVFDAESSASLNFENNYPAGDLRRENFQYLTSFTWLVEPEQSTYDPAQIGGFHESFALEGALVTGVGREVLQGKQYWEVEVVTLQVDTPEPQSLSLGIDPGPARVITPLRDYDYNEHDIKWPQQLNTFFSPAIGVIHESSVEAHPVTPDRTRAAVGLDADLTKPRSVGVVPCTSMTGVYALKNNRWITGHYYYTVDSEPPPFAGYRSYGTGPDAGVGGPVNYTVGDVIELCGANPDTDRQPGTPAPDDRIWTINEISGDGDSLFWCVESGTLPETARGPSEGMGTLPDGVSEVHFPIGSGGSEWCLVGHVGDALYYPAYPGFPETGTIADWAVMHRLASYLDTSTDETPDQAFGDFCEGGETPKVPWGVEPGRHAVVFKGRGDFLAFQRDPETAPYSEPDFAVNDDVEGTGIDTGVNLGGLAEGDRIMLATDTVSQRIWFGKNGVWYGPDGAAADPAAGTGHATALDVNVAAGEDGPRYYPAASVKIGPAHVIIHCGQGLKYKPPAAFTPYGQSAPEKIQTGEEDDPG